MATTTIEKKARTGIINPIFNCQPAGAQFACLGIRDAIPLVHGGQGCCTFVRLMFAQHFNENFDIATSSLHEDAAVFGGMNRVIDGAKNLALRYPDIKVIPIITTCSTETIGDDIESCVTTVNQFLEKEFPDRDLKLVPIHTPSYSGSQVKGYDTALLALVQHLAKKGEPNGKVNIITGWINPGDVQELKYICSEMEIDANILMDSTNFGTPIMPNRAEFEDSYRNGSTTVEEIGDAVNASATVALYKYEGGSAAAWLESEYDIPAYVDIPPIGIANTDKFLKQLSAITGKPIPHSLAVERGKALNSIVDLGHMFLADKKVAIYGDPDLVIGLADFCMDLGMKPQLLLFGDDMKAYERDERILAATARAEETGFDMEVVWNADFWELERRLRDGEIELDLMLGHSKGRFISFDYNVPLVRVGFPVFDRAGMWKNPIIGYKGAELLANEMANALFTDMEYKKDREWLLNVW